MKIEHQVFDLKLKEVFRISRSATESKKTVLVQIEEGIGEASSSSYYGESFESVVSCLKRAEKLLDEDIFALEKIHNKLLNEFPKDFSARAGIDLALYDAIGKKLGLPLYKYLGISKDKELLTSYTIGIDKPEEMQRKVLEAKDFPIYKVKVGIESDMEMVKAVREVTKARIRVDANAGWTPEEAVEKINKLEKFEIEFVEQPIDPNDLEGLKFVKRKTPLPIFIDEWLMNASDIPKYYGIADGINIKLMKCGGITEAVKMIHTARALGMKIMLGCMIESSVGITAAAHLGSLVDYLDLDGNILISNDPYTGVKTEKGRIHLSDEPGLGVFPG